MAKLQIYQENLNLHAAEEIFQFLVSTMKETIRRWDYFVDWIKIREKVAYIERPLNLMNSLIGKENIRDEFKSLLSNSPEILDVIPILIACRERNITILNSEGAFTYESYFFNKQELSADDIERITTFVEKVGILTLFNDARITNIVDYVFGVEVGLDTNARKNRSGTTMEEIVEQYINSMCRKNNWEYIAQANQQKIRQELGYSISLDKTSRYFDFAVDNGSKLFLIETNYYSGGGSKLKATAGEYKAVYDFIKSSDNGNEFIWITDGKGWETTKNALLETFNHIDYILNLEMIGRGMLEKIVSDSTSIRAS